MSFRANVHMACLASLRTVACDWRSRRGLMRPSSEYRDTCRVNVVRCAAKIGHTNCANHRPLVGAQSFNFRAQRGSSTARVGERRFLQKPTGCGREAFRPTDSWYSTMKAGEMPHARSRSALNETLHIQRDRGNTSAKSVVAINLIALCAINTWARPLKRL